MQITNAATGAVLSTQTVSSFQSGIYLDYAISGNVLITFTREAGPNAVLSGLFFDSPPGAQRPRSSSRTRRRRAPGSAPTAQGYDVIGSSTSLSLPSYATVTPAGQSSYTWASSTTDPRALQVAGGTSRIAATWYSATSFTVDVDLTDGQQHDLELYFLDWDKQGRSEQVQITNAATGAVLSTQTVSSFQSGIYLDYTISGNVLITFTREAGTNAVLSGLFLDPTVSGSASISNLSSDRTGDRPAIQTSTDGVPAPITDFLGAVVDAGLAAGPGASSAGAAGPAPQAAVELSGTAARGVSVPITARGPRPDGNLLRGAGPSLRSPSQWPGPAAAARQPGTIDQTIRPIRTHGTASDRRCASGYRDGRWRSWAGRRTRSRKVTRTPDVRRLPIVPGRSAGHPPSRRAGAAGTPSGPGRSDPPRPVRSAGGRGAIRPPSTLPRLMCVKNNLAHSHDVSGWTVSTIVNSDLPGSAHSRRQVRHRSFRPAPTFSTRAKKRAGRPRRSAVASPSRR